MRLETLFLPLYVKGLVGFYGTKEGPGARALPKVGGGAVSVRKGPAGRLTFSLNAWN